METQNILDNLRLSLLNVDDFCARNWKFRNVTSPFTRIYRVKDGEGFIVHNHKKFELQPGKLYLVPSFTSCDYESLSFLEHIYLHFIPQLPGGVNIFNLIGFDYEIPCHENDDKLLKRLLEINPDKKLTNADPNFYTTSDLLPQTEALQTTSQISAYMETQGILFQLFSRFIQMDAFDAEMFRANQSINLALEHIHQNLSGHISVGELAGLCNLSGDYFSRLFQKIMGTRTVDYINRRRIESAQLKLVTTNDSIDQIANETGFENFPYFNRLFKRYTGNTPGAYRKLHRKV